MHNSVICALSLSSLWVPGEQGHGPTLGHALQRRQSINSCLIQLSSVEIPPLCHLLLLHSSCPYRRSSLSLFFFLTEHIFQTSSKHKTSWHYFVLSFIFIFLYSVCVCVHTRAHVCIHVFSHLTSQRISCLATSLDTSSFSSQLGLCYYQGLSIPLETTCYFILRSQNYTGLCAQLLEFYLLKTKPSIWQEIPNLLTHHWLSQTLE